MMQQLGLLSSQKPSEANETDATNKKQE